MTDPKDARIKELEAELVLSKDKTQKTWKAQHQLINHYVNENEALTQSLSEACAALDSVYKIACPYLPAEDNWHPEEPLVAVVQSTSTTLTKLRERHEFLKKESKSE